MQQTLQRAVCIADEGQLMLHSNSALHVWKPRVLVQPLTCWCLCSWERSSAAAWVHPSSFSPCSRARDKLLVQFMLKWCLVALVVMFREGSGMTQLL